MNHKTINKNVPTLNKPVARLGIVAYPVEKAGEIFIDEILHPSEAITGEFPSTRTLKSADIRAYASKLLELADYIDEQNDIIVDNSDE